MMVTLTQTVWILLLLQTAQVQSNQYVLEVPDQPDLVSAAVRSADGLVITNSQGEQFVYVRKPQFDTREFIAYYTAKAGRYLRWPVRDTGGLEVGTVIGGAVAWTPSRMRVRRLVPPAPRNNNPPLPIDEYQEVRPLAHPLPHLSVTADRQRRQTVALIDSQHKLQYFHGRDGHWIQQEADLPDQLLSAHAPLQVISHGEGASPSVFSVNTQGEFVEMIDGRTPRRLPGLEGARFRPGSQFDIVSDGRSTTLFAVDSLGKLWELDLTHGTQHAIESRPGLYEPGTPVKASDGGANQVMLVDRRGNLVAYSRDPVPGWRGPQLLDTGYSPGGDLTVWQTGQPGPRGVTWVAASDRRGSLRLLHQDGDVWDHETLGTYSLPPGSSMASYGTADSSTLFAVLSDGRWVAISEQFGRWEAVDLGTNYPPGAPVAFEPRTSSAFVVDGNGRVVGAQLSSEGWQAFLLAPDEAGLTPRLERRREVVNRGLAPVNVQLVNTHSQELIVSVVDTRFPDRTVPQRIPPGKSITLRADRDLGRTIEETYLFPGPGETLVEQTRQLVFPPQGYYEIVVAEQRVTYTYIDRRKKRGPLENYSETTPVSIGTFALPPGELLQNGTEIDVYREAARSQNPGAAALLTP